MKSSWLLRYVERPHARGRLFCFPHAGVGGSAYRLWHRSLPEGLDVCAIQPPGREDRLREPPHSSIAGMVEDLLPALRPALDLPFAFFGHSMGAVVAAEVARSLEQQGAALPSHLFVSGRRPPHVPGSETPIHRLPDAEFTDKLQERYGGIPAELLKEPEIMQLLLPGLRADFCALETHRPPRRGPLSCAISVFGGADDPLTPREHLEAWRNETRAAFRVRVFPGGHFYLSAGKAREDVLADLAVTLAPLL